MVVNPDPGNIWMAEVENLRGEIPDRLPEDCRDLLVGVKIKRELKNHSCNVGSPPAQ